MSHYGRLVEEIKTSKLLEENEENNKFFMTYS